MTGRSDTHCYPIKVGDNRLEVSYYATQGALMQSVTLAGRPGTSRISVESGHPVYRRRRASPRISVVLHLSEPAAGAPIVLRQPLLRPLAVTLKNALATETEPRPARDAAGEHCPVSPDGQ